VCASRGDGLTGVAGDYPLCGDQCACDTVDCGIVMVSMFFRPESRVCGSGGEPLFSAGLDRHDLVANAMANYQES